MVAPGRGQAQGPLIHATPPLVPTGCGTHISRCDCQTASGSHSDEDKHQAPSSTPPRPLSLQDAGRTFPDAIVKQHQGDWSNGQGLFFTLNHALTLQRRSKDQIVKQIIGTSYVLAQQAVESARFSC